MPFRRQDALGLPQKLVGLILELELVHHHQGIDGAAAERQIVVPGSDMRPLARGAVHHPLAHRRRHRQGLAVAHTAELHQKAGPAVRQEPAHGLALRLGHHSAQRRPEPGLQCGCIHHGAALLYGHPSQGPPRQVP